MRDRGILLRALVPMAFLAIPVLVRAGAPDPAGREANLPHVCKGGSNGGNSCDINNGNGDCPNGRCVIEFTPGGFAAKVTILVDDNVSKFDGSETVTDVVAATVILEVKGNGQSDVLAQTYQNLAGADFATLVANLQQAPFLADTEISASPVDEAALNAAAKSERIVSDLMFQKGDSEVADALRTLLGATGNPVVTKVTLLDHFDHGADQLASVVQLKVRGRFVP